MGWKCRKIDSPSDCKCGCEQNKQIILVWKHDENQDVKDVFNEPMNWATGTGGSVFHGVRAKNGCSTKYREIMGHHDEPKRPKRIDPEEYMNSGAEMECCCQDN